MTGNGDAHHLDEQCARGNLNPPANGAHSFRYDEEWLRSPRARPLSLSLPLQYGNITADAVYHYFDNLLPDSPQVRERIVRRYQARSKQPFDLLAEVGRDSVGAVTLLPPGEEAYLAALRWQTLDEAQLTALLTAYQSDIPLGMVTGQDDFRISWPALRRKPRCCEWASTGVFRRAPPRPPISLNSYRRDKAAQCDAGSA